MSHVRFTGHVGHISLPVPVYNPLLFEKMFKILKMKCLACHHFRLASTRVRAFQVKLMLADCGDINTALTLENELLQTSRINPKEDKKESSENDRNSPEDNDREASSSEQQEKKEDPLEQQREILEKYESGCLSQLRAYARKLSKHEKVDTKGLRRDYANGHESALRTAFTYFPLPKARSPHVRAVRSRIMKEFLASMPTKQCDNCGAPAVGLRKDGSSKIFMKPLSKKSKQKLDAKHLTIQSAVDLLDGQGGSGDEQEESADEDQDDSESGKVKRSLVSEKVQYLTPTEVEAQLKMLWQKEREICSLIWAQNVSPHILRSPEGPSIFFFRTIPVAPSRFRPPTRLGDMQFEHPQNYYLGQILSARIQLKALYSGSSGDSKDFQQAMNSWLKVQDCVNGLIDSTKSSDRNAANGIRQVLEKKEGLFRQNMMGKRVNYAARSVISPDPLIRPDQIGVPLIFAMSLTYPSPVTPWNVEALRRAVINGPNVHPGANFVEDEAGRLIDLSRRSKDQREALARTLLTPSADASMPKAAMGLYGRLGNGALTGSDQIGTPGASGLGLKTQSDGYSSGSQSGTPRAETDAEGNAKGQKKSDDAERDILNENQETMRYDPSFGGFGIGSEGFGTLNGGIAKRVWRHLQDGDAVLMNRQPTLHKPSIMAHSARVLRSASQQTLRLHYANCKTYNADFDGDEMNMHYPQDELARAEAYMIASTKNQFIVPTDGQPIRGLIQDHLSLGVLFTMKDNLLDRDEYQQFVFSAMEGIPEVTIADVTGSDLRRRSGGNDSATEGRSANMKLGIEPDTNSNVKRNLSSKVRLEPPAILKPYPRWTGKQVITTILRVITADIPAPGNQITFTGKAKVHGSAWSERTSHLSQNMLVHTEETTDFTALSKSLDEVGGDDKVIVRGNEMCTGVLDKSSLGASAYGLPHAIYELYGASKANSVISAFGRLLTVYLQKASLTCSMDDLSMTPEAELERRLLIKRAYSACVGSASEWCFGGHESLLEDEEEGHVTESLRQQIRKNKTEKYGPSSIFTQPDASHRIAALSGLPEQLFELPSRCRPKETAPIRHAAKLRVRGVAAQAAAISSGKDLKHGIEQQIASWDEAIKGSLSSIQSSMINACLPKGLYKPFPENHFSLMVQTGAKGSKVNHAMIVCGLGQQELEGRRVPLMSSGKSLPSFPSYDPNPRAGGYVSDRFLSGLRPQEYFFHCMSGREGLVDTAVKTANSGYLQRCMIKHLEDLRVSYDHTVRDGEGSIIQFLYGEDGLDVCSGAYLPPQGDKRELMFLADNYEALKHTYRLDQLADENSDLLDVETAPSMHNKVQATRRARAFAEAGTPPVEDSTGLNIYHYSIGESIQVRRLNSNYESYQEAGASRRVAMATNSQELIPSSSHFVGDAWVEGIVVGVIRDGGSMKDKKEEKKSKKRKRKEKKNDDKSSSEILHYEIEYRSTNSETEETVSRRISNVVPYITEGGIGWVLRPLNPSPVTAKLPVGGRLPQASGNNASDFLGVVSENLRDKLDAFGREYGAVMKEEAKRRKRLRKKYGIEKAANKLSPAAFSVLLSLKALRSRVHPGEPVGVIASQSVGEPSTQMTLNTFHLAGHGGVNVTLGIPRLREIVMTASRAISTPTMTLALQPTYKLKHLNHLPYVFGDAKDEEISQKISEYLARKLTRLSLADLIDFTKCPQTVLDKGIDHLSDSSSGSGGISVYERLEPESAATGANYGGWIRSYEITLNLVDHKDMEKGFGMNLAEVASLAASQWPQLMLQQIDKETKRASTVAHAAKITETEQNETGGNQDNTNEDNTNEDNAEGASADDTRDTDGTLTGNTKGEGRDYEEEEEDASDSGSEDNDVNVANGEDNSASGESADEDREDKHPHFRNDKAEMRQIEYGALQMKDLLEGKPISLSVPHTVEESPRFHSLVACLEPESTGRGCWLRLRLTFPASHRKVLMLSAAETTVRSCLLSTTKGIARAIATKARLPMYDATRHRRLKEIREHKIKEAMCDGSVDEDTRQRNALEAISSVDDLEAGTKGDEVPQEVIQTEGVNIHAMWAWDNIIDPHRLYTNDVGAILKAYGVEAARASIIREVRSVFEVYGIAVDPRHLSLIADYMTYEGGFKGMNRIGMENAGSSFTQMSFETTTKFLTKAATHGATQGGFEQLESPSSRLIVGQSISYGTGSSNLRQPISGL